MKYFIPLDDQNNPGRLPVLDQYNTVHFMILGNLNQNNNTIFLNDINSTERARMTNKSDAITANYLLQLPSRETFRIMQLSILGERFYYINKLGFWILGNSQKNEYTFRRRSKKLAHVTILLTNLGPTLQIDLLDNKNVEVIILTSMIFTQPGFITKWLNQKKGVALKPTLSPN